MSSSERLADLLTKAEPRGPAGLRSQVDGATLALALHCLMVEDGFVPCDAAGRRRPGFAPGLEWNGVEHVWGFDYSRPGALHRFRLQCSLQVQTRRMFIHASELNRKEEPMPDNIQVMGLQLDNYVSGSSKGQLGGSSWEGVMLNENTLKAMFAEFISAPLFRLAEKQPEGAASSISLAAFTDLLHQHRHAALAAAAVGTAVAVGVLAWTARRRSTPSTAVQ